MEQIILTSRSASDLNQKVKDMIAQGWTPVGGHYAVEVHHQLRYAGTQHKDTYVEREYSQTVKKD